jgi:hypothetical protein
VNFSYSQIAAALAVTVGLTACVQTPMAPMIAVVPGPNKTFDAFGADQAACQQYAAEQTAPSVAAANSQAFGAGLFTTALGAAIGGAVGGGHAAGIGAASGAGLGALGAAGTSGYAQQGVQQQYDIVYGQCMAAHGNSVPAFSPPPGTPPYSGRPSPYSGRPSPYSGGPSPYSYGPSPPPPGGTPYSGAPVLPPSGY